MTPKFVEKESKWLQERENFFLSPQRTGKNFLQSNIMCIYKDNMSDFMHLLILVTQVDHLFRYLYICQLAIFFNIIQQPFNQ